MVRDPEVCGLLDELDVCGYARDTLFDMFDRDGDGYVTLPEFIDTLVKCRGDVQKSDIIASWVALRSLQEHFEEFANAQLAIQQQLMQNQAGLLAQRSSQPPPWT